MGRRSRIGIQDVDYTVASNQHFVGGRPLQDMPVTTRMSGNHVDSTPVPLKRQIGTEPGQYSLSERKLQATAFAGRVHSLKYYIGLIGASTII